MKSFALTLLAIFAFKASALTPYTIDLCNLMLTMKPYDSILKHIHFPSVKSEVKHLTPSLQVARLLEEGRLRTAAVMKMREELVTKIQTDRQALQAKKDANGAIKTFFNGEARALKKSIEKETIALFELDLIGIQIHGPLKAFLYYDERALLEEAFTKIIAEHSKQDGMAPIIRAPRVTSEPNISYSREQNQLMEGDVMAINQFVSQPFGTIGIAWLKVEGSQQIRRTQYERTGPDYAERMAWQVATLGTYRPRTQTRPRTRYQTVEQRSFHKGTLTINEDGSYKIVEEAQPE